jgi:glutamate:Na+ symporter, ESS family
VILGLLLLLLLSLAGIFAFHRRSTLFQLLPLSLIFGAVFLLLSSASDRISELTGQWSDLPGLLINVVFATLFLGRAIMPLAKIWGFAGPQIVFGQTLAWGQYVVGIGLTALVLVPVYSMSPLNGALIEISFEGGPGTAAGLEPLFGELGFSEGADLALGLATVGFVGGLATGLIMTAIWRRRGGGVSDSTVRREPPPLHRDVAGYLADIHGEYMAIRALPRTLLQLGFVALAIFGGIVIKWLLGFLESALQLVVAAPDIVEFIPLFPLAMIGGIGVQLALQKTGREGLVHSGTISFIGAIALELVIITAIATIALDVIADNLVPFVLLAAAGTIWNISGFLVMAPKLMDDFWFERGLGDYGQSMGMTVTGLLLMRSADPGNESQAMERFGYKQLLFEPIVGGGLFTATSMILIAQFGQLPIFVLVSSVLAFWLWLGWFSFGRVRA